LTSSTLNAPAPAASCVSMASGERRAYQPPPRCARFSNGTSGAAAMDG
jgi:hypothetical protein